MISCHLQLAADRSCCLYNFAILFSCAQHVPLDYCITWCGVNPVAHSAEGMNGSCVTLPITCTVW